MSAMEGTAHNPRVLSFAVDEIARAALSARATEPMTQPVACDVCEAPIEGEPAGSGLYVSTRGDEIRYEEPPLCQSCATAIGLTALAEWAIEDEG